LIDNKINISIVIVNYNSADYLEQCLISIEKATNNLSVETIVVDNNSTDSPDFVKFNRFQNTRIIELSENLGFSKANNIGVSFAKGEFILILNPDTLLEETTLSTMYNYMLDNHDVGAAGCKVLNSDGSFQLACRRGFPTPWVSFTKLFGLQKLFPKSRLFGKYNQTFRSIDDTYEVDSVIGAFMFIRKQVWDSVSGFNEAYFMYGEDIDLCSRINKAGWKISYVSETSIIHYKGISTHRSSIDELSHFYDAMAIYSKDHFSNSWLFLFFLRMGIWMRKQIAKLLINKQGFIIFLLDLLAINVSLAVATKIRFGDFFNFPDYAYPTVFLGVSLTMILSMISTGEYLEGRHSVSKSLQSLLISLFVLSAFTYFFKEYAFSRGVVLMTIAFTIVITTIVRIIFDLYEKIKGKKSMRKLAIVGIGSDSINLYKSLQYNSSINTEFTGFILTKQSKHSINVPAPVLGSIEYLDKIIIENQLNEIVVCDDYIKSSELFARFINPLRKNIRFHFVKEINEFIASGIINDIEGKHLQKQQASLTKFKYRIIKRATDILVSLIIIFLCWPVLLVINSKKFNFSTMFKILMGKIGLIGTSENQISYPHSRQGLISFVDISNPELITPEIVRKLDDYYVLNYTITLDLEIFFKYILRKKSGNKIHS
jgi:GT2 family glycosyltransferase